MSSKLVNDMGKLGRRVASQTRDQARNAKASAGLIARCADVLPPETATLTLEEAQLFLGEQIRLEMEALRSRDNEHVKDLTDARQRREERDQAATEVYRVLLRVRQAFETIHGPATGTRLVGVDTTIPTDPERLRQTAERCLDWLRDPLHDLPDAQIPGFRFDADELTRSLEESLARLAATFDPVSDENRQSVDTLAAKRRAMERLDRLIGRGARWLEALYDIAGMEIESDRVRLSSHRPSQVPDPAPGDVPGEVPGDGTDGDSDPEEEPDPPATPDPEGEAEPQGEAEPEEVAANDSEGSAADAA